MKAKDSGELERAVIEVSLERGVPGSGVYLRDGGKRIPDLI